MTEKVLIFIIIAGCITAVTLIAAVTQIVKAICDEREAKHGAVATAILHEMWESSHAESEE